MIGTSIQHYDIRRKLGSGGMGEVYLAEDRNLRRPVALKVLTPEFAFDAERKRRFMQEAHAASILVHPHISVIHEIGDADGILYISMEYVEGETLADRILRAPMRIPEIAEIGAQVADAIDAAHAKGITHRDLKPANIMLTPRGHVKVLDFGIAKLRPRDEPIDQDSATGVLSGAGVILGTVPYMSPEQALGRPLDHRTDIFSIGVILYEMITRRLPFEGETAAERIANIAHVAPEPPSRINSETPPELERIVRKCLEKDPALRYQNARDLEVDLRALLRGEAPRHARNVAKPAIAAVVVLLVVAGALGLRTVLTGHSEVDSLAVLPFANGTHDPSIDYLCEGIPNALIDNLSQLPKMRVMARSTTFQYKNQPVVPKRIGKDLGVSAILAGNVVEQDNSLSIQAELIRTSDGSQIWGAQYDGQASDAASFQQRIAADVIRVIRGRLEAGEQKAKISRRGTDDPKAYELYLKGQYEANRVTEQSLVAAEGLFQQAIARDPDFALAYVGLADTYLSFDDYVDIMSMETLPKARAAAMKALQIDDTLPEAYASLAMIHFDQWEWDEAEKNFNRSIELNPNLGRVRVEYAMYLVTRSRLQEALEEARTAERLEPVSPLIGSVAAGIKLIAGQTDEGIADLQRVLAADPNMQLAHQWLAFGYLRKNELAQAIDETKKELDPSSTSALSLVNAAYVYHAAGRQKEADGAADAVIARVVFTAPLDMAGAYLAKGDRETALQWLERGMIDHSWTMNYITWPPWFDEIQSDPRYLSILRRMGLKKYNSGMPAASAHP